VLFFDGNYSEYEEDRKKRLGAAASQPADNEFILSYISSPEKLYVSKRHDHRNDRRNNQNSNTGI